jgi:hypothetical protein
VCDEPWLQYQAAPQAGASKENAVNYIIEIFDTTSKNGIAALDACNCSQVEEDIGHDGPVFSFHVWTWEL